MTTVSLLVSCDQSLFDTVRFALQGIASRHGDMTWRVVWPKEGQFNARIERDSPWQVHEGVLRYEWDQQTNTIAPVYQKDREWYKPTGDTGP